VRVLKLIPYPGAVRYGITTIGRVSTVEPEPRCIALGSSELSKDDAIIVELGGFSALGDTPSAVLSRQPCLLNSIVADSRIPRIHGH
jgi:hypothetical protein